jgi:hypothetical protein
MTDRERYLEKARAYFSRDRIDKCIHPTSEPDIDCAECLADAFVETYKEGHWDGSRNVIIEALAKVDYRWQHKPDTLRNAYEEGIRAALAEVDRIVTTHGKAGRRMRMGATAACSFAIRALLPGERDKMLDEQQVLPKPEEGSK